MPIQQLKIEKGGSGGVRPIVTGLKKWTLKSVNDVMKAEMDDETQEYQAIEFLFSNIGPEGEALCWHTCRVSFNDRANLPKLLEGMLGQANFEALLNDSDAMRRAINDCEGKQFWLQTRAHTSSTGRVYNKLVSIAQIEKDDSEEDDDVPF